MKVIKIICGLLFGICLLSLSRGEKLATRQFCDEFMKESEAYYRCILQNYEKTKRDAFGENRPFIKRVADFIRIILRITRPASDTALDVLYFPIFGPTKPLPPIDNQLLLIPALDLAEKVRMREVSSEEILRAYIQRAKAIQPLLNPIVDQRYEGAIKDAKEVDAFLLRTTKSREELARETPLLGLPFSCKEGIGVQGMLQTWGLVRAANHTAEFDADAAAMYRKAGGIPVTVTNVPEMLMWWESANHVNGMTLNPYDNHRSVGGSSGGEGSIITSAGALFGIGNDFAGSIRIPASFNGIYGHKPSKGIVSNHGDWPMEIEPDPDDKTDEFLSTGPMCRYAKDLPLLMKVLSGNDPRLNLDERVDFKKITVYFMEELPGYLQEAVPEVKNAIRKAVNYFESTYGIKAEKLDIPAMYYVYPIWESKILQYGLPPLATMLADPGQKMNLHLELLKTLLGQSKHTLPAIYNAIIDRRHKDSYYYKYLREYEEIERRMNETLQGKKAVLLLPTHPEPPPHYLMTIPKYPNIGYTMIFNILGLPSTNIPAGLSSKGLPLGIQAVSGMFQDHLTLATAVELDSVFKGWRSPSPVRV